MKYAYILPTVTADEREVENAVANFLEEASSNTYFTYLGPREFISTINGCIEGAIFLDLIDHSEMG